MASSIITRLHEHPRATQALILLTLVIAFAANIYGIFAGITIVLPHLFYIPIILAAFFYPRRGVLFAAALCAVYLIIVTSVYPGNSPELLSAVARCIVYLIIAIVVSWLSEQAKGQESGLARTTEEWENTFDAVPDLIALIGKEHRILRVNKAMADSLGITPEQAIGLKCYEVVHHTGTHPAFCPHAMLMKDGQEHIAEIHEENLGGDFLITTTPLHDSTGNLIGSVHVARDITKRKTAEQALKESEEKFLLLLNSTAEAIYGIDMNGNCTFCNNACLQQLGYDHQYELLGKNMHWQIHGKHADGSTFPVEECRIFQAFRKGEGTHVDDEVLWRADGSSFPAEYWSYPQRHNGQVIGAVVTFLDITERRQAENALREKTLELDQYFTTSLDLFCIADTQGYFRRLNAEWEKTLGYTLSELEGRRFLDFVHPDDMPGTLAAISDLSAQKEVLNFTNRYLCKDGTYRWIEWRSFPKGERIFAAARDITKRKRAEEALRDSEEKYRTLVESSFDGIAIHQEGILVYVNKTAARILGAEDPEVFLGRPALDIVAPEFREQAAKRVRQASYKPLALVREQFLTRDGTPVDVEVTTAPSIWKGKPAAYVTFRDITARVRAEGALRESEERYRTIIENIQDVYFRFDQESRLLMMSPSATRTFGYNSVAEMLGCPATTFWKNPEERAKMIDTMKRQGGTVQDWEAEFVKRDGTPFWVSVSGRLHTNDAGEYRGTEGIIRDISGRKKTDEALKSALNKLNMLSSITRHDILNQISGLRTYLELSKEDLKGTRFEEYINKEDEAAEAIQRQIEFTKYYQDIGVNAPKWQDAGTVIREAAAQISLPSIDLQVTVEGIEIFADPLIVKVFFNLMENSLRHGEGVTAMSFSSRVNDTGLVITYCDNGVGITEEDKKKLFRKGFGKHTGLGLFLSREILAITGISIIENGEPGAGVRFEITVPKEGYRHGL
ncbi:MAG: PAS domain S-box protein [Methanoregula sp.]|nr:PAS domain S-box protein [Methanoregula sp.]